MLIKNTMLRINIKELKKIISQNFIINNSNFESNYIQIPKNEFFSKIKYNTRKRSISEVPIPNPEIFINKDSKLSDKIKNRYSYSEINLELIDIDIFFNIKNNLNNNIKKSIRIIPQKKKNRNFNLIQ